MDVGFVKKIKNKIINIYIINKSFICLEMTAIYACT